MGDLFTIKLDLSTITHSENERLYILLVDPTKMKMIYQFKLWIRFLFSIDCPIKLVYDGAVIHDLEDINIFKLLKIVHVERADYDIGEREQQEKLIAKLNRYDEWQENSSPTITPQKQCQSMNGDSFQPSYGQCQDIALSKIESSELDSVSRGCGRQEKQEQDGACLQRDLNTKCGTSNKAQISLDTFNRSLGNLQSENSEMAFHHYFNSKMCSQKDNNLQSTSNYTPASVFKSDKTNSETTKQRSTAKRSVNKPFSLYHFLHALRTQESNPDSNKVYNNTSMELDKNDMPDIKLNGYISKNEEEDEKFMKRKRKRIRKHKNQKNKMNETVKAYKETFTSLHHERQKLKSISPSPKPKHIRFDAEEDNGESTTVQDQEELANVSGQSVDCHYNLGYELMNDNKCDMISDDCANEVNTGVSAAVEVKKNVPENNVIECGVKNIAPSDTVDTLTDSSANILDILGSLRRKGSTPPVFDRFATCV